MVNRHFLLSRHTASCSKTQVLLNGPCQADFSASCKSVWSLKRLVPLKPNWLGVTVDESRRQPDSVSWTFADSSGSSANLLELSWRLVVHRMTVDIVKLHLPPLKFITKGNSSILRSGIHCFAFSFC